jgi:hypothetical protein
MMLHQLVGGCFVALFALLFLILAIAPLLIQPDN